MTSAALLASVDGTMAKKGIAAKPAVLGKRAEAADKSPQKAAH
jgi:hypothetical protein